MATKKKKTAAKTAKKKAHAKAPKKKVTVAKKKKKPVAAAKKKGASKPKVKARAKAKAKAKAKPKKKTKKTLATTTARRDNAGHLDPQYERDLQERVQEKRRSRDDDTAFLGGGGRSRSKDDLAEELGEEAVLAMTSGEDQSERWEAEVEEEAGGPFIKTKGSEELAGGTDESNPEDATREPFPLT